jgi:hypothetical protein
MLTKLALLQQEEVAVAPRNGKYEIMVFGTI